jgi:hypothetical protein
MALAGLLYAALVWWLREADPDHGLTPWLVVVGDGLVCVGLYLRLGQEAALELLALLAIAGVPQIVGYTVARTRRRKSAAKPALDHDLGLR